MSLDRLTEKICQECCEDEIMKDMLLELFECEIRGYGWMNKKYGEVLSKYVERKMMK